MGPLWWLFNLQTLFLVLFLGWTYLVFRAGYWARGEEDLTRWLNRIMPPPPPDDDPPTKSRV